MKKHHIVAGAMAGLCVLALLVDTAVVAATGERTFVTDDAKGDTWLSVASSLWLGATFASLAWVAAREGDRFAQGSRVVRVAGRVLLVGLVALAVGAGAVQPTLTAAGVDEGPAYDASGLVAFLAISSVILSALVLGLAVVRRNPLGLGGRVLGLLLPAVGLTVLLAAVAPDLASPVFCTMVVLGGVALVGVRAETRATVG